MQRKRRRNEEILLRIKSRIFFAGDKIVSKLICRLQMDMSALRLNLDDNLNKFTYFIDNHSNYYRFMLFQGLYRQQIYADIVNSFVIELTSSLIHDTIISTTRGGGGGTTAFPLAEFVK